MSRYKTYETTEEMINSLGTGKGTFQENLKFASGNGYWYSPGGVYFQKCWPKGWEMDHEETEEYFSSWGEDVVLWRSPNGGSPLDVYHQTNDTPCDKKSIIATLRWLDRLEDMAHAKKVVYSFLSGFSHLAEFGNDGWQPSGREMDHYYTCLEFNNGKHLPLPIFDDPDGSGSDCGPYQKAAIKLMAVLAPLQIRSARKDASLAYRNEYSQGKQVPTLYSLYKEAKGKLTNCQFLIGNYFSITPFDWSYKWNELFISLGPFTKYYNAEEILGIETEEDK